MKNLKFQCLILVVAATTVSFIFQDDPLKKILTQLEKYRTEYVQEKVHLHLDKPYYAIGDNIWFKAYVVGSEDHRLSNISRILYVDLINEKDSIKQSLRLPVNAGLAWGDFTLSDSLKEGNYRIRAYTRWMRNFGEEYFFDKTIRIGNSISNSILTKAIYTFSTVGNNQKVEADITYTNLQGEPLKNKEVSYHVQLNFRNISRGKAVTDDLGHVKINFVNNQPFILRSGNIFTSLRVHPNNSVSTIIPVKATSNEVDLQFFPEGGSLVNQIRSKVAFKAVGADGLGVAVYGKIVDQHNNTITEFKAKHAGMGYFGLTPKPGETYQAIIKFQDGSEKRYLLPKTQAEGYVLTLNNLDTADIKIKVTVSPTIHSGGELKLVAQLNGVVYYVAKAIIDKSVFTSTVEKKRFPSGILQFTLFTPQNEAVAERLVFINNSDFLSIGMQPEKQQPQKREKVRLALDVKGADGKPAMGSFSMAVVDESKVVLNEDYETSILSNLLLTSDLKGYVEQPNYYFNDYSKEKALDLDLLMLTQGWRRFVWKNILSDAFPSITYTPETTISVSGTVTTNNGQRVVGGKVTLFSSAGDVLLMDTVTDGDGRFVFKDLFYNDSTKFVIQARNQNGRKNVQIELDRIPPQLVTKNKNLANLETNVNVSLIAYLLNSHKQYEELKKYGLGNPSILLSEVKITETRPRVQNSSNLNGAGNADNIISAKDLQYATDLPSYLHGRVAGIIIMNGIAYSSRSMLSSFSGPVPMQLVVDGMFVSPSFLGSINPQDVESIEVLKSVSNTAIYGLRGGGGVLVINTKRGERNMSYDTFAPGIISFKPQGLYKSRQFYAPNYDDPKINSKIADLRSTIYWNPNIVTDSNGKSAIEFFNADGVGRYAVVVEGIDLQGHIGRTVYRYSVN